MSEKIPASGQSRNQVRGGRAGRAPGRDKVAGSTNTKNRIAPGMPGEARPYPGHPDPGKGGLFGNFFGRGGKP